MDKKDNLKFIKKTESLVRPQDVTAISFLGDFNRYLPKKTQQKLMKKGSEKIPYMGFVVDPYCFFLTYRITDRAKAQSLLPEGYELAETAFFKGDEKHPTLIVCAFSARTSAFAGIRLEFYIIARDTETGLISWIIADYETNTNSHDPKNGFCGYTCDKALYTTTPYGELISEFKRKNSSREFSVVADIKSGEVRQLDEVLWVEGNLSVDYGGFLKDESSENFSLIFDPVLMKEAFELPLHSINLVKNTYFEDLIDGDTPVKAAVFPYSQHFIIKQNLRKQDLTGVADLMVYTEEFLDAKGFKKMRGEDIKKPLFKGIIISALINWGVIIFLILKVLSQGS